MKIKILFCVSCRFALAMAVRLASVRRRTDHSSELSRISPAGMERGSTATFTVEGRNLSDAKDSYLRCARHQRKVDSRLPTCPRRSRARAQVRILERRCRSAKNRPPSSKSRWPKMSRRASIAFAFRRRSEQPTWLPSTIGTLPEVKRTSERRRALARSRNRWSCRRPWSGRLPRREIATVTSSRARPAKRWSFRSGLEARLEASNRMLVLSDSFRACPGRSRKT